jgi:hypothetical protein
MAKPAGHPWIGLKITSRKSSGRSGYADRRVGEAASSNSRYRRSDQSFPTDRVQTVACSTTYARTATGPPSHPRRAQIEINPTIEWGAHRAPLDFETALESVASAVGGHNNGWRQVRLIESGNWQLIADDSPRKTRSVYRIGSHLPRSVMRSSHASLFAKYRYLSRRFSLVKYLHRIGTVAGPQS